MWNLFYIHIMIFISNYKLRRMAYKVLFFSMLQRIIGVEPFTQVSHVPNKNTYIQGRSLYAINMITHTHTIKKTALKGKKFAPSGSTFFPLKEVPIWKGMQLKRIIAWSSSLPLMSITFQRSGYPLSGGPMYWCHHQFRVHKFRVASSVSSMFACKQRKKRYKTYGRRHEQADFAACELQIPQTSLRVRAD